MTLHSSPRHPTPATEAGAGLPVLRGARGRRARARSGWSYRIRRGQAVSGAIRPALPEPARPSSPRESVAILNFVLCCISVALMVVGVGFLIHIAPVVWAFAVVHGKHAEDRNEQLARKIAEGARREG